MKKSLLTLSALLAIGTAANAQTKNCLIEEFSSSTCGPCATMNAWLDPMLKTANANKAGSGLVVVKYQMDFPNPGTDASFNAHGDTRASTYIAGMTQWGIPLHFTNGKWEDTTATGGVNTTTVQNELTACKGGTADVDITGSYTIKAKNATTDSIFISITVTPKKTLTTGNYKLFVAATEEHYINNLAATGHTTSQTDFYYVMRKMFPDGNGTSLASLTVNTPQTFTWKFEAVQGSVTQNSFKWWGNPYDGAVVAFVSDMSKPVRAQANVLQAVAIPAAWATNVQDVANIQNIKVIPNPATDVAGIFFNLATPGSVAVNVMDLSGRVVYRQPAKQFGTGAERILIPTDNFANGVYIINLQTEKGSMTQRLTVEK